MRASERQRTSGHQRPAWPGNAMNVEKAIVYAEREGYRALELDLYQPAVAPGGPRPLLVYVHGGGWRQSHRSRAPRETRGWSADSSSA